MSSGVPADAPARPLTLRRVIARPREQVFDAWTDPNALVIWFGGALGKTLTASVDLRVGGRYRLTMQSGTDVAAVEGVYREVKRPERLVYTWRWDRRDIDGGRESLVTVEFLDRGGRRTEVVLTHEGLVARGSFAFHVGGWTASLDELRSALEDR